MKRNASTVHRRPGKGARATSRLQTNARALAKRAQAVAANVSAVRGLAPASDVVMSGNQATAYRLRSR